MRLYHECFSKLTYLLTYNGETKMELKLLRSTDSFRSDLKTFLFHSVYKGAATIRIDHRRSQDFV